MEEIEFVSNYSDLSTERGFQFEFTCNRCGNGYHTPFATWTTGVASGALDAASSLLGGIFNQAADMGERVRSATWQQARDSAFKKAVGEVKPQFPRCSQWVCRKACWNNKRGLCKECAPDLGVEMSAAQASRSVEEVWAHTAMAEEDKKLAEGNWRETIVASCPKCGAPLAPNAKFCPECGEKLKVKKHCTECGAPLEPNAKFCAECGIKTQ
jgi:membrane protease subunit (stomatin/prohibitin family)